MHQITVHVPENRVEDFYIRFGEFLAGEPADTSFPAVISSRQVPQWALSDEAQVVAERLWAQVSGPGRSVLIYLARQAKEATAFVSAEKIARDLNHPKGKSGIAGILGGVGKAIRRADLPVYSTHSGGQWHYLWDWDGDAYAMEPQVAQLLIKANNGPARDL
ncbi:hypothetical protein ACUWEX_13800 [Okibacterium fritillariae]|uniref:hypothetical protein n=1 Tax=Okibacterium fritillariae TaxID=123320 RepID=UPI0040559699